MNSLILKFSKLLLLIFSFAFVFASNPSFALEVEFDPIVEDVLKEREIEKPFENTFYNYQSTVKIPIKISVLEAIKSENDVYEGESVDFEVVENVYYRKKPVIKKGTKVKARIGTVITSGMNGIPASIIFDNFEIEGIEKGKLSDTTEIFGQDRCYIVFPLKWALTFLPPTGSLTNFIMGGHAKLRTSRVLTIYYYPEWL